MRLNKTLRAALLLRAVAISAAAGLAVGKSGAQTIHLLTLFEVQQVKLKGDV
jgi:hypothetical protein